LQNAAPAMGVAVDPGTAEQSSHVFQFREAARTELKGIGEVDVFVLDKRKEAGTSSTTVNRGSS